MADEIESEIEVGWDAFASAVGAQKADLDRAIRQRIAALTEVQLYRLAVDGERFDLPEFRAALVALLAPEAPNG